MRAALLFLVAGAAPVFAQSQPVPDTPVAPAPSAPLPSDVGRSGQLMFDAFLKRDARRMERVYGQTQVYARCSAELNEKRARALLAAAPSSPEERSQALSVTSHSRGCFGAGAAVPLTFLRGSLAEALLRNGMFRADADIATALDVEQVKARYGQAVEAEADGEKAVSQLRQASECHAMIAGGLVDKLLDTAHGSEAERGAFRLLYASAPVCGGATWPKRIASSLQRAMLAEARYQWLRHGAPAPRQIATTSYRAATHA